MRIVSSKAMRGTIDGDQADPIQPVEIRHTVEELWTDEHKQALAERYNYLEYHFEHGGRYCRARAYLDDPHCVTLFGPFRARGSLDPAEAPEFEDCVLRYLNRRFRKVERFQVRYD